MRILVIADEPAKFQLWLANEASPALQSVGEQAARGAEVFHDLTCVKCHAIGGTGADARVAPDLTHIASRRTLAAGAVDENTPANLAGWLKNPDYSKPGSHMPNLRLSDAQVNDLVTYFETLR
jgi:cytochrome c oxidase subunit 2